MSTKSDKKILSAKSHRSSRSHHCKKKGCKKEKICAKKIRACSIKAKDIETETLKAKTIETETLKAKTIEAETITGNVVYSGCERLKGVVEAQVSLETPCYTFQCAGTYNIQTLDISKKLVEPKGTLVNPLEVLPILNPPSDVLCPTPGGDPLVTSTVDVGVSFQVDYLIFTNTSTPVGTDPVPEPSTGPWYFEKEPFSASNKTVITAGCRETYTPVFNDNEQQPPIGPRTLTTLEINFDNSMIDPLVTGLQFDISYGFSTEAGYDFFTIVANGENLVNVSGPGVSPSDPYVKGNVNFQTSKNNNILIQFSKDSSGYGGVDTVYFTINKVVPIKSLQFPTTLTITRGTEIIQNYLDADLDSQSLISNLTIDCPISVQKGDQLCLNADTSTYSQYNVSLSLENIPQIKDHKSEETFSALVQFNEISYNNRATSDDSVLQGWYDTDVFSSTQCFITNVAGCGSEPSKLIIKNYSARSSGAYFLNDYWNSSETIMIQIGINLYQDTSTFLEYRFNPDSGELRLDVENPNNIPIFDSINITIYRPIGNPDEKYWKYNFDLKDYNHQFNTPINFYDFVSQYYKAGFISSMFGIKSYPTWPEIDYPLLNPLQLDQTKVAASFGVDTSIDYDNLVRVIRDIGIKREYDIQRFVYWPQPGPGQPVLTALQKEHLQWQTNINRYPFLGFTTRIQGEGEHNYPKFCPGETVTMMGTGTRLDNFPLRLAMDGYHTGPKPAPDFMQTYSGIDPRNGQPIPSNRSFDIYNEWGFYTMRLPITIDSSNDTINSRSSGFDSNEDSLNLQLSFTTNPVTSLGPFTAFASLLGSSLATNPISGKVVVSDPLNAATLATNIFNTSVTADIVLPQAVINVVSTVGFPPSGVISVETDDGFQDVTYTGITPTSFTGCSGGDSFTGVDYFVSKVVILPQPVIEVNSTAGFPVSGKLIVFDPSSGGQTITYTGLTPTSFTGCVGGIGRVTPYFILCAPLTNASNIAGNVALIIRGAIGFSLKAYMALAAGATGVILYNTLGRGPFVAPGVAVDIPVVGMGDANGTALKTAVDTLTDVNVNLEVPSYTTKLPHGTYYLSDIYQYLYDEYNAFRSDFFIDVGNFVSVDFAINNLFVLAGTTNSALYGPDDVNTPSNFFGPSGINVAYLWGLTPSTPLLAESLGLDLYFGSYAQLVTGEYKTHTPLTSVEAQLLIDAVDNNTVSVGTQHGPVTANMTYEKYIACINELSMSKGTEVHTITVPWTYKCDNGLFEIPISFSEVMNKLKLITLDPDVTYAAAPDGNYEFGPNLYASSIRATGTGHPGEFSDNYNSGAYLNLTELQTRSEGSLEWIVPQERFFYPEGTAVPTIGDVSNRQVEITIVNYLEDPQWLGVSINSTAPYVGAPDFKFIPYIENSSIYAETRPGTAPPVIDPDAVAGDWLIGTLKDEKVREILNLAPGDEVPKYGYIRNYFGDFSSIGNPELLPWNDDNNPESSVGIAAAAKVLQYFNNRNVKHFIIDIRNVVGGNDAFFSELASLIGGKRYFATDVLNAVIPLEPNGINSVYSSSNMQVARENAGVTTYKCIDTILDCNPEAYIGCDLLDVYPNGVWNGEITGQSGLGLKSNVIWLTNGTSISNPQAVYCDVKSTSLNGTEFNGDFGKDTQFVAYGVYYRPFSTGGNYTSYINWWTKGRKGEEEVPNGLLFGIDRYEGSRTAYLDGQVDGKGGVLKGLDQDFSRLHQPQIKWDMSGDVFFQDIGFTVGNPGVNPVLDGEPWLPNRYPSVDFSDPTTWKDSILERCVQMAADPNLASHFYVDDGYGYVNQLP